MEPSGANFKWAIWLTDSTHVHELNNGKLVTLVTRVPKPLSQ